MQNTEPVRENETHKVVLDFKQQTDPLISARGPDLEKNKKKGKREINTHILQENF